MPPTRRRPRGGGRSEASDNRRARQTRANGSASADRERWTYTCPLCGSVTAAFGRLPTGRGQRWWIKCSRCESHGTAKGNYLRQLAEAVDANGGAVLLDDPPRYLERARQQAARPTARAPSWAHVEGQHQRLLTSRAPLAYLMEERGLSLVTVEAFKLGFDGTRLVLPFFHRGWPVAFKTRVAAEGSRMRNGRFRSVWTLYPEPLERWTWCLLVAGEFDALRAHSIGLPAASVPLGAGAWSDAWVEPLRALDYVVVCFDNGEQVVAKQRVRQLRRAGIDATRLSLARDLGFRKRKGDLEDYLNETCDVTEPLLRAVRRLRKDRTG